MLKWEAPEQNDFHSPQMLPDLRAKLQLSLPSTFQGLHFTDSGDVLEPWAWKATALCSLLWGKHRSGNGSCKGGSNSVSWIIEGKAVITCRVLCWPKCLFFLDVALQFPSGGVRVQTMQQRARAWQPVGTMSLKKKSPCKIAIERKCFAPWRAPL